MVLGTIWDEIFEKIQLVQMHYFVIAVASYWLNGSLSQPQICHICYSSYPFSRRFSSLSTAEARQEINEHSITAILTSHLIN